jgi:hypothetical protein
MNTTKHMDIFLFDVMPTDGRSGSLAIESYATGAVDAGLPPPDWSTPSY